MHKFYILFFLLPALSYGQDSLSTLTPKNPAVSSVDTAIQPRITSKNYLKKDIWRIDFLGPGYLNEHRLGRQLSLVSQLRLVGSFRSEDQYESTGYYGYVVKKKLAFSINPEVSVALRHFYNLPRRKAAGKSFRYNSGSYFAAKAGYIAPPIFNNSYIDIRGLGASIRWGVQHTAPRHFYVNLELGAGVAQYYKTNVSLTGDFLLGYTF